MYTEAFLFGYKKPETNKVPGFKQPIYSPVIKVDNRNLR
jgi:hypothetical protein